MTESVILCEGYHDRAFWKGWLEHLGCVDPGLHSGKSVRTPILDPWGTRVVGGQYAFHGHSGQFIRLVPCHGKTKLRPAVAARLSERKTKSLAQLVVNFDSDQPAHDTGATDHLSLNTLEQLTLSQDHRRTVIGPGDYLLDAGQTRVSGVVWTAPAAELPGVPRHQTLERIICAATATAFPERGHCVKQWLESRPNSPARECLEGKEIIYSYMAGWHAEQGSEPFYSHVWTVPPIRDALIEHLKQTPSWKLVEQLVT